MFLVAYILLGILGFFLVTFAGSHMLEARLEKSITSDKNIWYSSNVLLQS